VVGHLLGVRLMNSPIRDGSVFPEIRELSLHSEVFCLWELSFVENPRLLRELAIFALSFAALIKIFFAC